MSKDDAQTQTGKIAKYYEKIKKLKLFSWHHFPRTAYIHGIYYVGMRYFCKKNRLLWLLIFTTCFALCMHQCGNGIMKYYKRNTKTTVKNAYHYYSGETKRLFPTIGFCNQHTAKKSVLAKSRLKSYLFAILETNTYDEAYQAVEKVHFKRGNNHKKDFETVDETYVDSVLATDDGEYEDFASGLISNGQLSSDLLALTCWLGGKKVSCSRILVDMFIGDLTKCFYFNIPPYLPNKTANDIKSVYELNSSEFVKVSGFGQKLGGFRVLLDAIQQETYELTNLWNGAGFRVFAMAPGAITGICRDDFTYSLSPGYSYQIGIKQSITSRHTKDLGLCNTDFDIMTLKKSDMQQYVNCFAKCVYRLAWNECHCYPPYIAEADLSTLAKFVGVNNAIKVKACSESMELVQCAMSKIRKLKTTALQMVCPDCRLQCYQEEYQFQISAMKFPQRVFHDKKEYINLSASDKNGNYLFYRKNNLMANFYYLNNDYIYIEETQEIDTDDLFVNYIGNAITLFMGMSFLSPFQLLFQVLIYIHYRIIMRIYKVYAANNHRKRKVRPVVIKAGSSTLKVKYKQIRFVN